MNLEKFYSSYNVTLINSFSSLINVTGWKGRARVNGVMTFLPAVVRFNYAMRILSINIYSSPSLAYEAEEDSSGQRYLFPWFI
jgi:hypothetical protein